jgi:hypothetical protein
MMDGTSNGQAGLADRRVLLVNFGAGGNSHAVRAAGWSGQEADWVWTVGPHSTLTLPLLPDSGTFILDLDITPCRIEQIGVHGQMLAISIAGHLLGRCRVTGPCRLQCRIPAELFAPDDALKPSETGQGRMTLSFEHPCYACPDLVSANKDGRPLAIRFFGLRLYPDSMAATIDRLMPLRSGVKKLVLDPVVPGGTEADGGTGLTIADQAEVEETPVEPTPVKPMQVKPTLGEATLLEGWHVDADGVAWTASTTCIAEVPVPAGPGPYALTLGEAPLVVRDLHPAQRLVILAEGMLLGHFRLKRETALSVGVPAGLVEAGRAALTLTLILPDAVPMSQFAYGEPGHRLGTAVDWITLQGVPPQLHKAVTLRGDEMAPLAPLAVSERYVDLPADEVHAAIEADLGIKPAEVMRGFESLGDNCAFGLAQRKAGAEILGLLRFANTSLRALLRGLADGFKAATQASETELYLHDEGKPREYMLKIARYGIRWHTLVNETVADAEAVGREQIMKLGFLRRKFEEGLRNGRKIYTLVRSEPKKIEVAMPGWGAPDKATSSGRPVQLMPVWDAPRSYEEVPPPLCVAEAMAVLLELNRTRPNTLLFFTLCPPGKRPGTVELLAPGLMRGYMASYVILPNGESPNDVDWLRVAANAWLLKRAFDTTVQLTEAA